MSAPLLPIPPLIAKGEGVLFAEPMATPCWKVDDNRSCPEPLGVMVRFWFEVVPSVTPADPLPKLTVFAEIPRVPALVMVANPESDKVVAPESVRVEPDVMVLALRDMLPVPKSRVPTLEIFFVPAA